jgi:hypothetical protein
MNRTATGFGTKWPMSTSKRKKRRNFGIKNAKDMNND